MPPVPRRFGVGHGHRKRGFGAGNAWKTTPEPSQIDIAPIPVTSSSPIDQGKTIQPQNVDPASQRDNTATLVNAETSSAAPEPSSAPREPKASKSPTETSGNFRTYEKEVCNAANALVDAKHRSIVSSCPLCLGNMPIVAIVSCCHLVCWICSLRLIALYKIKECSFCKELNKWILMARFSEEILDLMSQQTRSASALPENTTSAPKKVCELGETLDSLSGISSEKTVPPGLGEHPKMLNTLGVSFSTQGPNQLSFRSSRYPSRLRLPQLGLLFEDEQVQTFILSILEAKCWHPKCAHQNTLRDDASLPEVRSEHTQSLCRKSTDSASSDWFSFDNNNARSRESPSQDPSAPIWDRVFNRDPHHGMPGNGVDLSKLHQWAEHQKKAHQLLTCFVCLRSLKRFSFEHYVFKPEELKRHIVPITQSRGSKIANSTSQHTKCPLCRYYAYDLEDYTQHIRRDHFSCFLCEKKANECKLVAPAFMTFDLLERHYRKYHYVCTRCPNSVFGSEDEYRGHYVDAHNDATIFTIPAQNPQNYFQEELQSGSANSLQTRTLCGSAAGRSQGEDLLSNALPGNITVSELQALVDQCRSLASGSVSNSGQPTSRATERTIDFYSLNGFLLFEGLSRQNVRALVNALKRFTSNAMSELNFFKKIFSVCWVDASELRAFEPLSALASRAKIVARIVKDAGLIQPFVTALESFINRRVADQARPLTDAASSSQRPRNLGRFVNALRSELHDYLGSFSTSPPSESDGPGAILSQEVIHGIRQSPMSGLTSLSCLSQTLPSVYTDIGRQNLEQISSLQAIHSLCFDPHDSDAHSARARELWRAQTTLVFQRIQLRHLRIIFACVVLIAKLIAESAENSNFPSLDCLASIVPKSVPARPWRQVSAQSAYLARAHEGARTSLPNPQEAQTKPLPDSQFDKDFPDLL